VPAHPPLSELEKQARIEKLYRRYRWLFRGVPELTAAALRELEGKRPVVLVDVRAVRERQVSTLPGARTPAQLEGHGGALGDSLVVAYCTIGLRSGRYARRLLNRGLQVHNLRGSILAWTHAGGELEAAGAPTRRVHVGSARWALQAEGYEAVW
jgi:rhodanese-related sulfurtransferase